MKMVYWYHDINHDEVGDEDENDHDDVHYYSQGRVGTS